MSDLLVEAQKADQSSVFRRQAGTPQEQRRDEVSPRFFGGCLRFFWLGFLSEAKRPKGDRGSLLGIPDFAT